MMSQQDVDEIVQLVNEDGASSIVLVCEHASAFIPPEFDHLGLSPELRKTHVAWDPGALGVALELSDRLDAALIASRVSRLVYDCNRPPEAPDAMPERSEVIDIPGNKALSTAQKSARTKVYYAPFHAALSAQIDKTESAQIVTIHSFTPVYHGQSRNVEIGILHDTDSRLADAMLDCAARHTDANVQRNQPYGAEHGVTHTLKEHALPGRHLNVMLEIRNDLIKSEAAQTDMAKTLATWLQDAITKTAADGDISCAV